MKISQDVREYAAKQGISDINLAVEHGMSEKAEEFKRGGSEIYSKT